MTIKKIKLKKIEFSDLKFMYYLYNEGVKNKVFINKKKITIKNHKEWFLKHYKSKKTIIYISNLNNVKIGYVKFDILNKYSAKISIIFKKNHRKKGYASLALKFSMSVDTIFSNNTSYSLSRMISIYF